MIQQNQDLPSSMLNPKDVFLTNKDHKNFSVSGSDITLYRMLQKFKDFTEDIDNEVVDVREAPISDLSVSETVDDMCNFYNEDCDELDEE